MGVRSAIASTLTRAARAVGGDGEVAKAFGNQAEPALMAEAARDVSQMTMGHPFAPGEPIGPYDGYSRTPRTREFVTGANIATRPRIHERVSFDVLKGLISNYDVAKIAIWHRIDSIRSLDWQLVAMDGHTGDVTEDIARGKAALKRPDRVRLFKTWLGKWLYDVLAYDAGTLYRMRNLAGQCVGLKVIDGTLIAPLQDYWGELPDPPAEAFVQYVNGLPWNWLTRDDLIYEPFRPVPDSLYGSAPIEAIILNANTDIRFQLYFLQRFTEGNIPEAFASAPETWGPAQIEQWQGYWDGFMYGDQSQKHQIKWIPGGSTFAWSNEKDFTDTFSLFLMRKTCAAFHVVPADLGFTENVNRSSGESQADVQHRVGELPLDEYVEAIITAWLQDDLGLPLEFQFDRGEEQVDQLAQAQADGEYIDRAVVSSSEIRQMRYGLAEPAGQIVPRYIFSARAGPIPLASLYGVAGKIDAQTGAPDPGVPLPHEAFTGAEGVVPNPPLAAEPLAEQEFGPKAIPPAPPKQVTEEPKATDPARQVAKEAEGPAAGISTETGLVGYDLIGHRDDEDDHITEDEARAALAKAEMQAFHRFARARRKAGSWRDFEFAAVDKVQAHRLNDGGRLAVRKAAGEIAAAGLAVQAQDTGRVLMLQRALCDDDPAAGKWEFPGGHIEGAEKPIAAAAREWSEETGALLPFDPDAMAALAFGNGQTWTSSNGIYQGFVYPVPCEAAVPVRSDTAVSNPDDPDGDLTESIAWWNPADIPGNPVVRAELVADIDAVMAALGCGSDDVTKAACPCCNGTGEHSNGCECTYCDASGSADGTSGPIPCAGALDLREYGGDQVIVSADGYCEYTCPCGMPAVFGLDGGDWWSHADGSLGHDDDDEGVSDKMFAIAKADPLGVAKAGGAAPKVQDADQQSAKTDWPGWKLDLTATAYWAPLLAAAFSSALNGADLASAWLATSPVSDAALKPDRISDLTTQATAWLGDQGASFDAAITDAVNGVLSDGYAIGTASAEVSVSAVQSGAQLGSIAADMGDWAPGASSVAREIAGQAGNGQGLDDLLSDAGVRIRSIGETKLADLARVLAEGAENGSSVKDLAASISGLLTDPSHAEMVASTELARASNSAAFWSYRLHAIERASWVTAEDGKVCPICDANAAAGPLPLGEAFPSGDTMPPAHPWDRCAIVPA